MVNLSATIRHGKSRRFLLPLAFCFSIFLLSLSCEKEEGYGGTCTLTGKILVEDYNGSGILQDTFYGPDERVYLIYGADDFYGDEIRTHYDGSYRFEHLYKGSYTVFAYTECDTCHMPDMPVLQTVTFSKEKETIVVPDIIVRR